MPALLGSGGALTGPAPLNFRATVTGSTVRLDWDYSGPHDGFLIEAGSSPGLSNLASARVPPSGSGSSFAVFGGVPPGVYFVRIAAFDAAGPATRSGDITVQVGGRTGPGCTSAPGAPGSLTSTVAGNSVTLSWSAPPGDAPTSYFVEAGTSSGGNNAAAFDTGNPGLSLSATAPNGRFFVRVRGRNPCGTGPASNEHVLDVGGGPPPPPPPPGSCPASIAPTTQSVIAAGGTLQISVTAPAACTWTAAPTVPWITVMSGSSGSGTGTVTYAVDGNAGPERTGSVVVSGAPGQAFSTIVTQGRVNAPPPPPVNVTISQSNVCVVRKGCPGECDITARTDMPSPQRWDWDFGLAGKITTFTDTVQNLTFDAYCTQVSGTFPISISVTITGAGGLTVTRSGTIQLFET
jgi:hypothetical protein